MADECFPTGTTYRVVPFKDKTYGVEVTLPGKPSYAVDTFSTEAEGEAWITAQKQKTDAANHGFDTGAAERWARQNPHLDRD